MQTPAPQPEFRPHQPPTAPATAALGPVWLTEKLLGLLVYAGKEEQKRNLRRSREGIEAARKRGVKFGPPRTWTDDQAALVRTLYDEHGMGYIRIAKQMGMSVNMVRRILGKGGDHRIRRVTPTCTPDLRQ